MKEGTREGGRAFRLHYRTSVQGGGEEVGTESVVLPCNSKKGRSSSPRSPRARVIHQRSPGGNRTEPGMVPHCAQSLAGSSLRDVWSFQRGKDKVRDESVWFFLCVVGSRRKDKKCSIKCNTRS